MSQKVRFLKRRTIQYSANDVVSEPLGRGMVLRELHLKLIGAPTLAATKNTQAATLWGDEWSCVKRIEIIANNTDVLRSFSGNELWWLNYFMYGAAPHITSNLGDGATANVPFGSTLIVPFWLPRSVRSMDTALDTRDLSDLKVQITWGDYEDINADASAWTTDPYILMGTLESFDVKGPFSGSRIYSMEKAITADNPQFQVQLPVGAMYRGFLLNTTDAGKDDGTTLTNFKIKSGSTVFADLTAAALQQYLPLRMGIDRTHDSGAAVDYFELRRGTTYNALAGWYYLDLVTDGFMTEAIDTLGFSEFELELDVLVGAGTTKLRVIPIQIYPVRSAKK